LVDGRIVWYFTDVGDGLAVELLSLTGLGFDECLGRQGGDDVCSM
jgi:hypothetical protein